MRRIKKVILRTILLVFVTYTLVGGFGYIGFARNMPTLTDKADGIILVAYGYNPKTGERDYFNFPVVLVLISLQSLIFKCLVLIAFSVIIAIPMNVKPTKDSLRDTLFPEELTTPDQDPPSRHVPLVLCNNSKIGTNF